MTGKNNVYMNPLSINKQRHHNHLYHRYHHQHYQLKDQNHQYVLDSRTAQSSLCSKSNLKNTNKINEQNKNKTRKQKTNNAIQDHQCKLNDCNNNRLSWEGKDKTTETCLCSGIEKEKRP